MGRGETEMQLQNPSKQVYDFVRPLCGGRFVKDDGQSLFSGITCESEIMGELNHESNLPAGPGCESHRTKSKAKGYFCPR